MIFPLYYAESVILLNKIPIMLLYSYIIPMSPLENVCKSLKTGVIAFVFILQT